MRPDNIVYIGRKPTMSYVMAILSAFNNSTSDSVVIKARGRAISTAVDAAEICRNRYLSDLDTPEITIETEQLENEGETRNVSCINITLRKANKQ
ncbi:MAG: DNA-binding protein Alba [Candidatus Bathyarchaeota archaeon]|nr:DNA-binding protein Alba [Candidatus Bathyarchaeota archaeon]